MAEFEFQPKDTRPLEEEMATHSVFLPGKSHEQRSLVGYRPWGREESERTEHTGAGIWTVTHQAPLSMGFPKQE